jgi:glycosyltransferase involved in cell wall biosynthesis
VSKYSRIRLVVITTHPIQYHAPLFSYIAKNPNYILKVFYTIGNQHALSFDKDFGIERNWNIDLLSEYEYEYLSNYSKAVSSNKFWGIINPAIINKIEEFSPNAILVFGWKHHSHLKVLRHFKGKVLVLFRGDSTTLDDIYRSTFFNILRYKFLKWVYQHIDYVLSPGIESDQYFKKVGIPEANIIHSPHAVDNERFSSFSKSEEIELKKLRESLLISDNEFVFLFAGKFYKKKNPILLIKGFELLASINHNVRLILVGNGILEHKISKQISILPKSILSRVMILPFQDQQQIKMYYRLANVFVLPSISETWGLSVNESLASGTPVLVSNKCGCAYDLVKYYENGLIFESNNLLDLFDKMKEISNANIYYELKKNAQQSVHNFSYASFEQALDKIMTEFEV